MTAMKPLPSLCTLISLILFPLGALGSPFLDQDFQNLSKGPLTTGSGWAIGNSISSNVIADPADASNNVLELKRTSSSGAYVNYSTSSTSPLVLKPETSYEWNFSFRLDSATPRSGSAGSFIWLDTGSNAQTFAGLYIRYNAVSTISAYELYYYSDLGGASNALGSYTLLGTINPGE